MPLTLGYWGIKGLGEICRITAHLAGAEYTEWNPSSPQEWAEKKATLNTPYPNLPFIDHDGKVLTESVAICHYLAKTFRPELAGNTHEEEAQIHQAIGVTTDIRTEIFKAMFNPDHKTALANAAASGKVPDKIAALSKALGDGHYLVGGHVTIADAILVYFIHFINIVYSSAELESPFAHHANIVAYETHFWALPELQALVASDAFKRPVMPPTMVPWIKF